MFNDLKLSKYKTRFLKLKEFENVKKVLKTPTTLLSKISKNSEIVQKIVKYLKEKRKSSLFIADFKSVNYQTLINETHYAINS